MGKSKIILLVGLRIKKTSNKFIKSLKIKDTKFEIINEIFENKNYDVKKTGIIPFLLNQIEFSIIMKNLKTDVNWIREQREACAFIREKIDDSGKVKNSSEELLSCIGLYNVMREEKGVHFFLNHEEINQISAIEEFLIKEPKVMVFENEVKFDMNSSVGDETKVYGFYALFKAVTEVESALKCNAYDILQPSQNVNDIIKFLKGLICLCYKLERLNEQTDKLELKTWLTVVKNSKTNKIKKALISFNVEIKDRVAGNDALNLGVILQQISRGLDLFNLECLLSQYGN